MGGVQEARAGAAESGATADAGVQLCQLSDVGPQVTEMDAILCAFHEDPRRGAVLADWFDDRDMPEVANALRTCPPDLHPTAAMLRVMTESGLSIHSRGDGLFWYWRLSDAVRYCCDDERQRVECERLRGAGPTEAWGRVNMTGELSGWPEPVLTLLCACRPNHEDIARRSVYGEAYYPAPVITLWAEKVCYRWTGEGIQGEARVKRWVGRCDQCNILYVDETPTPERVRLKFESLSLSEVV